MAKFNLDAQRALFEAKYGSNKSFAWLDADGNYKSEALRYGWQIWQDCLAAQAPVQGESVASDSAYLQELISLWENGDVGVVDFQERLYAIDAARKAAKR